MKNKKVMSLYLAVSVLTALVVSGCSNTADSEKAEQKNSTDVSVEENTENVDEASAEESSESEETSEDKEAEAQQLLMDLTGSYEELWPVILADEYQEQWVSDCAELVGKENAQASYEKLISMVTGTIYGEEAAKAYADGSGVYDCDFLQGVAELEFDGDTSEIRGYDKDGKPTNKKSSLILKKL